MTAANITIQVWNIAQFIQGIHTRKSFASVCFIVIQYPAPALPDTPSVTVTRTDGNPLNVTADYIRNIRSIFALPGSMVNPDPIADGDPDIRFGPVGLSTLFNCRNFTGNACEKLTAIGLCAPQMIDAVPSTAINTIQPVMMVSRNAPYLAITECVARGCMYISI